MTGIKILITTDTHFGHKALWEKHNRDKGFEEVILRNLAKREGDILIHLGDFSWKDDEAWTHEFAGHTKGFKRKWLIRGNHDFQNNGWYLNHGFDFVADSFRAKFFGKDIHFTHYPHHKILGADYNIHGHLHGKSGLHHWEDCESFYDDSYHFDAAPDDNQLRPYNLEDVIHNMEHLRK